MSAMQLVTRYASVELMSAIAEEADRILEFSGLDPKWEDRFLVVSLRSESGSGTVLCRKVSALRGGEDPFGSEGAFEDGDVLWSTGG
ncbi:hypothetical protein [Streptomyces peucetius]|uniref:Uncharacterized protein n=1 Tax=Streptomyces peucetius TaxID=1950 RepID=A0ABY6I5N1_STRPE|nr:hypothetical protein [Streptomyces peucetius]UYQ62049.1 hypothetical protein OGH68_11475 [Streptomyces peucetius]